VTPQVCVLWPACGCPSVVSESGEARPGPWGHYSRRMCSRGLCALAGVLGRGMWWGQGLDYSILVPIPVFVFVQSGAFCVSYTPGTCICLGLFSACWASPVPQMGVPVPQMGGILAHGG